jgi:DNA-binding NtrC family response regulator
MPVRLSVLFIEKEDAEVEPLLCELRQAGYEPHWDRMTSSARYLAALSRQPEIILASHAETPLGAMRALELLHEQGLSVPLIVIGEGGDEQLVVDYMRRGAADYVRRDRRHRLGRLFRGHCRSSIGGMSSA